MRTATSAGCRRQGGQSISILAVLADRDPESCKFTVMVSISILAVLADRDLKKLGAQQRPKEFQSSRSLRTATHVGPALAVRQEISILAVLADRDVKIFY